MTRDTRVWTIARRDLANARQSRLLWGAFALIFLLVVPSFWSMAGSRRTIEQLAPPAVQAVGRIPGYLSTYLFVLVVALAYAAVVSERESGTVRLLLGLPGTRPDVLVGKLVSRGLLLVATLVPLLVLLGTIILLRTGQLPVLAFALIAVWVLLYGLGWTTFAVGLSAAFESQYRALAAIAGTYIVFAWNAPIWKAVLDPLLTTVLPAGLQSYVNSLNPTLTLGVAGGWLVAQVSPQTSEIGTGPAVISALSLMLVALGGLLIGHRQFERADLG
jgi:ABC-type transport system involved in multi-copper enzyme maturation permease subunit